MRHHGGLTFAEVPSDSGEAFAADGIWRSSTHTDWVHAAGRDRLQRSREREHESPFSHLLQGLFQASPRVAQQWDFSVAPLMLTSQRLLMIFSQQVLLIVSGFGRETFLVVLARIFLELIMNVLICEYKQENAHSPMHSRPEVSRELPIEHKHTKDPGLFLHSPLIQGLD